MTNELRTAGTGHLLEAAKLVGAKRFVTQSMIFGYGFADHGNVPITEDAPFGQPRGPRVRRGYRAGSSGWRRHSWPIR